MSGEVVKVRLCIPSQVQKGVGVVAQEVLGVRRGELDFRTGILTVEVPFGEVEHFLESTRARFGIEPMAEAA